MRIDENKDIGIDDGAKICNEKKKL